MNIEEMNNQINEYDKKIADLNSLISGLENMDDVAADNMGTANSDLVEYRNQLAEITRSKTELQARIASENKITEIVNLRAQLKNISEEKNRLAKELEVLDESLETTDSKLSKLMSSLTEEEKKSLEQLNKQETSLKKIENQIKPEASHEQSTSSENKEAKSLLNPNFNPSSLTVDEIKKMYKKEMVENQNDEQKVVELNNRYNKLKEKWKNERNNPNFLKDSDGKVIYYPNTSIPYPRGQKTNETAEDYNKFLNGEFAKQLENGNYFNKEKGKNSSVEPEDKEKIPRIEAKPDAPRTEATSDVPRIEAKPDVPRIEEKPKDPQKEQPKHKRTLDNILYSSLLVDENNESLYINKKTGKRLQASNVQVRKSFKNELHSGNWLYNVTHVANNTLKLAINFGRKSLAKFNLWRTKQKEIGTILDENVANLSKEDWETVRSEYIGGKINEKANIPSALNYAIEKRVRKEAQEQVGDINQKIAVNYQTLFSTFDEINNINEKLNSNSLTESEKDYLKAEKQALLAGKGEMIKQTRDLYNYGNSLLSSGSHGFSEDIKAAESGMNKKGFRFSKRYDYDEVSQEVQKQQAILSQKESDAIVDGNDEMALNAFVNLEMLKSKETAIENSIAGKRSTGRMYYSPLVEELDYRDDPFIRDLFSTIAVVGAAVSVANAVHTHVTEANKVLDAEQAKAAQVNGANEQTMNQVHQTGQDIANHREIFQKGAEYQAKSDSINTLNIGERAASDQSVNAGYGWSSGPVYVDADNIAHATAKQMYDSAQAQIQDVAGKYAQGILSQAEVTQSLADIAKQANHTLTETVQNALPHFQTYMQNHPQFDLAEVGEAMSYLVQNPEAISKMYQGMTDVTNMGESLTGLTMSQVEALQSLPSDMQTTLLGAASTAALAYNTARTASNASKKDYGNEITDMVNEYITTKEAVAEETNSKAV